MNLWEQMAAGQQAQAMDNILKQNIAAQQQQVGQYGAMPTQTNLMPFMAATDIMSGSNLTGIYKPPIDERQKLVQAFQLRSALSDDVTKYLKAKLAGKETKNQSVKINDKILKSEPGKKIQTLIDLQQAAQNYKKLVDDLGITGYGKNATVLNSAYGKLKVAYKDAAGLGALTGPDIGLLEEVVAPATGVSGMIGQFTKGGKEGVLAGIEQMQQQLDADFTNNLDTLKMAFPETDLDEGWKTKYMKIRTLGKKKEPKTLTAEDLAKMTREEKEAMAKKMGLMI